MTPALQKVEALIARATDPGASEEEQRTSAVIAVRLIREHKLLSVSKPAEIPRIYGGQYPRDAAPARRIISSRYPGNCKACGDDYRAGDVVAWARNAGAVCVPCYREARAA